LQSHSNPIQIPDIRAGLAYFIAAVLADGKTELRNAQQLERGYGDLTKKLQNTNMKFERKT
jgi:UDP-N-acetylglucosamine 1-carboxyvinyltransferase